MRWILFLGRLLFGGFFLWAATNHVVHATAIKESLAAHSVPYPELALALSTLLLTLGGLSVVLGLRPRIGLSLIILFLIPTTFVMHAFWATDAARSGSELAMFMKNVALVGAALSLLALPAPWPLSVDSWLRQGAGFSGKQALARAWRRVVTGTQQLLRPSTRSSTQPASIVTSRSVVAPASDTWFIRQEAVSRMDGSIVVRRVRAYFYS